MNKIMTTMNYEGGLRAEVTSYSEIEKKNESTTNSNSPLTTPPSDSVQSSTRTDDADQFDDDEDGSDSGSDISEGSKVINTHSTGDQTDIEGEKTTEDRRSGLPDYPAARTRSAETAEKHQPSRDGNAEIKGSGA